MFSPRFLEYHLPWGFYERKIKTLRQNIHADDSPGKVLSYYLLIIGNFGLKS